jgi:hypothetical protein
MRINQSVGKSAPLVPQDKINAAEPVVIVVDDDAAVREALSELILSAGFQPVSFASTREVLNAGHIFDDGSSDEGGRGGFPHQAGVRPDAARCSDSRYRVGWGLARGSYRREAQS